MSIKQRSQMHLYVDDVDATFTIALHEGAIAVMEPNDRGGLRSRLAGEEDYRPGSDRRPVKSMICSGSAPDCRV